MAEPDHTVLARLSGLPDHLFTPLPSTLLDSVDNDEKTQQALRGAITGIEEIKRVVTCLLADSDVFREALAGGSPLRLLSWPLTTSTYASLLVAIHYLDECAGMLRHELHG
jgi:hypothetical protein